MLQVQNRSNPSWDSAARLPETVKMYRIVTVFDFSFPHFFRFWVFLDFWIELIGSFVLIELSD